MKKSPFIVSILAALLAFSSVPQAEASTYDKVTLTDAEPSWDVADEDWYYTYTDSITGVKYACYDLFVEAKDGRLVNGGWSSNIYIRSGAKLTADYLLQETNNPEGSELWRLLYDYGNDDYRLHINMEDNSSLNYTNLDLWLGVFNFQEGATVNISVASNRIAARAIGKYTDRDFTINAHINTTASLDLWNQYTSSVTLKYTQNMNVFVERGDNDCAPYIDASGKICLPEERYRSQLNGCAMLMRDCSGQFMNGYLKGTTLISLGNTDFQGFNREWWDGITQISWLLNNVEVREGCKAEMRRGYYGGTITLQKGSALKFDMEIMPAGVDDANWDGGINIIMKDSSTLDLAGRSLPSQYLDFQGTELTIKNGTIAGNLTLQDRTLALQDIRFNQEDMLCLWGGATLNLSGQSFETKHLNIAGKGNTITNGSLTGALELANTDLTLTSILSMDSKVTLWGDAMLNFDKQLEQDIKLEVYGTNAVQDKDGLITTSELRMGSVSALNVTGNISSEWIDMLASRVTATGDVIAGGITGSGYIGAQNIELDTLSASNMQLFAENSVQVKETAHACSLEVRGKNVTLSAVEIEPLLSEFAQIVAAEDIHITQGFIGKSLDAIAGGAITLASLGSEANPIRRATIISTGAGVTIEGFYGRTDADLPLQVESAGKVVIGKIPESGQSFPVVTGNMNIRYTGSGSGAESWDVEMLCELHGKLVVYAEQGRVSALTVKSNTYCDIDARQINLVSFVGDEMTLRASKSATVTKATAASSLSIIGLNEEVPDITIQSDMIAGALIELNGKNIAATGALSVFASKLYQINATNAVDIKSTFQGGKLTLTAGGDVTLGAVGDSGAPVESANIRSSGGAVNINWGVVASGALSLEGTGVTVSDSITAGNVNIHSTSGNILIEKAVSCASATMESAGDITVKGQVNGSMTATADGAISLDSFIGDSLVATAAGEISVKDVTIASDRGSRLSSDEGVVFKGNAYLQNTAVSAPLVYLGKWGLTLEKQSSIEGDVTAAAKSYIEANDSTITGSVSGVETVELENSTITGSVIGAETVELVNSTIGGVEDISFLKAEGASRINSNLVLEDDSPCFSFFLDAANSTTPVLALNGDLKLSPDVQLYCITIFLDGTDSLETGERYALISQTGGKNPDFWEPDNVIVTGLGSSADDLFWSNGTLYFRNGAPLETAVWTPGENHLWNTTDKNWTQEGRMYRYKDGVDVVFNDTGKGGEVQLEGALAPKGVLVEGNCDYTFTGTGKITGEAALTKNGSGTLTIENANEYSGGTFINGGTLVMKNAQALGSGGITLAGGTLDLGGFAVGNSVTLQGSATIGNGTIGGRVSVDEGIGAFFFGETHIKNNRVDCLGNISAGHTAIGVLAKEAPGLLKELSVSDGLIAGTDRQASLADGLYIESTADLMIKSMTITANNSISVGSHTITLNQVTIKMSDNIAKLEDGIFYFNLKSLINCELVMENVLLDASDLTLPQDFDPATTTVAFDFGDDVTIKQATGLDMRLGSYWSPTMNLDTKGQVIFTKLVPIPEPATGTISLLALCALATRRRRK